MENPMQWEIRYADNGSRLGYRVRFVDAKNHKVISWTQVYNEKRDAEIAIRLHRAYAATAPLKDYTRSLRRAS